MEQYPSVGLQLFQCAEIFALVIAAALLGTYLINKIKTKK